MSLGTLAIMLAAASACAGITAVAGGDGDTELGVIPIGGVPKDMRVFVESDCEEQPQKFADCSAQDAEGRRYAFFDGVLSKVSVIKAEAESTLRLPAALEFGENIEQAAEKVRRVFGAKLDRGSSHDGRVVYSSDFAIKSSVGVAYSIELIADEQGHLVEVVQRTDF
jgi:hypothetical protein